jgi:hypothetical protein
LDVVPRLEQRAGDAAVGALGPLAHVEDLHGGIRLGPVVQLLDLQAPDALDGALLAPPLGHPAGQEASQPADADRQRQRGRPPGVLVVASDQHDLLVATRQPGEPGPEPGLDCGDADRLRDVGVVEL